MDQLEVLKQKFETVGCPVELSERTSQTIGKDGKIFSTDHRSLKISIPQERQFKSILISDKEDFEEIELNKIEKFRFLNGYEGIWSKELSIIECELEYEKLSLPLEEEIIILSSMTAYSFFCLAKKNNQNEKISFEFPSPKNGIRIFLGECSSQYALLRKFQRKNQHLSNRSVFTIRIEGVSIATHDEAIGLLIKISNTIFFQFDLVTHLPLRLAFIKQSTLNSDNTVQPNYDEIKFSSPKYEYDEAPIALYMYARTSSEMPLLQYLAFYQVLEFYFPLYSLNEAREKIKNFIKNPLFDVNKGSDIAHIVDLIKTSGKGKSIGDERSQIKATIQGIIDQKSLLDFINANPARKDFFDQQKKSKSIAKQKINFSAPDNDIRIEIALRIYEIRCRVVHSKDEDEFELLLPYSKEVKELDFDIQLIEFLAQKAIIAASRPLIL